MNLETIDNYIADNVLHSKVWDLSDDKVKQKAINNAERVLKMMLPNHYKNDVPVEHIAEQSIWMLKIDDSLQRAEMGITYINVDCIAMNISEKDRSIAPYVIRALNLPNGYFNKRRVGRYSC